MTSFGEQLRFYRLKHSLSQKQLGNHLNVSSQAISKWENNQSQPDFEIIKKISQFFNISYDELFEGLDNGTHRDTIIPFNKATKLKIIYMLLLGFFAFLSVSLLVVTIYTYTLEELTWHFSIFFGLAAFLTLFFTALFSKFYFYYIKAANPIMKLKQSILYIPTSNVIIPLDDIKNIDIKKYHYTTTLSVSDNEDKRGKVIIYSREKKVTVRDVNDIYECKKIILKHLKNLKKEK